MAETNLRAAIEKQGDLRVIKALIDAGADPNQIRCAEDAGDREVLEMLHQAMTAQKSTA